MKTNSSMYVGGRIGTRLLPIISPTHRSGAARIAPNMGVQRMADSENPTLESQQTLNDERIYLFSRSRLPRGCNAS